MTASMLEAFEDGKVRAVCSAMQQSPRWRCVAEFDKGGMWTQRKAGWTYRLRFNAPLIVLERSRNASKKDAVWEEWRKAAIRDIRITPTGLLMPTWSIPL